MRAGPSRNPCRGRRSSRWLRALAIGLAAASALCACGSGTPAQTQTSGTSAHSSSGDASNSSTAAGRTSYLECMGSGGWSEADITRLEGEIFQSDPNATADPDTESFRADMMRCQQEAGMLPDEEDEGSVDPASTNAAVRAFVTCMRDRGWQLQDPMPGADGALVPPPPAENLGAQQQAYNDDQIDCLNSAGLVEGGPPAAGG